MATTTRGTTVLPKGATPAQIKAHIKNLQDQRQEHMTAAHAVDEEMVELYQSLKTTLAANGILPERMGGSGARGVRNGAGTGKILALIRSMAKDNVVKTSVIVKAAKRQRIKYPHSSFQSLKGSGIIKLKTPARGFITLVG